MNKTKLVSVLALTAAYPLAVAAGVAGGVAFQSRARPVLYLGPLSMA